MVGQGIRFRGRSARRSQLSIGQEGSGRDGTGHAVIGGPVMTVGSYGPVEISIHGSSVLAGYLYIYRRMLSALGTGSTFKPSAMVHTPQSVRTR
jgi:hypothetical protein